MGFFSEQSGNTTHTAPTSQTLIPATTSLLPLIVFARLLTVFLNRPQSSQCRYIDCVLYTLDPYRIGDSHCATSNHIAFIDSEKICFGMQDIKLYKDNSNSISVSPFTI